NVELNKVDDAVTKLVVQVGKATREGAPFPAIPPIPAIPAIPAMPPFPGDVGPGITVMPGQYRGNVGELVAGALFAEGLVFSLFLFVMWRWMRRHPAPAKLGSDESGRLEQLQRSVDVMAVEMERISESQRFVA